MEISFGTNYDLAIMYIESCDFKSLQMFCQLFSTTEIIDLIKTNQ